MIKLHKAFAIALMLLSSALLYASDNNIYFKHINTRNGLSSRRINCIIQDRNGSMWFGSNKGLNRYDGNENTVFFHEKGNTASLPDDDVLSLALDSKGRLWIGTTHGLARFISEKNCFEAIPGITDFVKGMGLRKDGKLIIPSGNYSCLILDPDTLEKEVINYTDSGFDKLSPECVFVDSRNRIWIGDFSRGLFYSDDCKSLHLYTDPKTGANPFMSDSINDICESKSGDIIVASFKAGASLISSKAKTMKRLLTKQYPGQEIMCRSVTHNKNGIILIGSESGLFIYDPQTEKCEHCSKTYFDNSSLSDNAIYATYIDSSDGLWIGTFFGGIDYSLSPFSPIDRFYPSNGDTGLHGERIREFCTDDNGDIWIGTEDDGLNVFNPNTKQFQYIESSKNYHNIHGLKVKDGLLWVGTFGDGIRVIDPKTKRIVKSYIKDVNCPSLVDNSIFSIEFGKEGEMYIGTFFGVQTFDFKTESFSKLECDDNYISILKCDSKGNLWAASRHNGLYVKDAITGEWSRYTFNDKVSTSIPSNSVTEIFEDASGTIWICTEDNGLARFNNEDSTFETFNRSNGFPEDRLCSIQESDDGLLWISSDNGLIVFNPKTKQSNVLKEDDGILSNEFVSRSSLTDRKGKMYFGSPSGFISFDPKDIRFRTGTPNAFISEIKKNGEVIDLESGHSKLKAGENNVSVSVEAMTIHASSTWALEYRMIGLESDWNVLTHSTTVNYLKLRHGKYTFELRAHSISGETIELQSYDISVNQRWYRTIWAYLFLLALVLLAVYILISFQKKQAADKLRLQIAEMKERQGKELYDTKMEFYTEAAHEIRTPVTLLNGPLENILSKNITDPETKEDLRTMKRSINNLMELVNKLLDFRKFESGKFELSYTRQNVCSIVKDVCNSFNYRIKEKNLDFKIDCPNDEVLADIDFECFIKIINNLVSNGIKYASTYVLIRLAADDETGNFIIQTHNDGKIINEDERESIFEPFKRSKDAKASLETGTGIGLVTARSLARLHGGDLIVEANEHENVFRLTMPLIHEQSAPEVESESITDSKSDKCGTILIVEDQSDLNAFIKRILSKKYDTLQAFNGKEAMSIMGEKDVDLIVTDLTMPVMDGMELCKEVKQNLSFSHIPLVMLTAKTMTSAKVEAMEAGADSYIEKPFSTNYLKAVVDNLIQKRRKQQEAIQKGSMSSFCESLPDGADRNFMEKVSAIISENYSDPEFRLDEIYGMMDMSKSNFYRKMKGITNMTPNDLLRVERLNRAAALLKSGKYRVQEICYMVGFSTPSYFTSCFQKQFGTSPKEYSSKG